MNWEKLGCVFVANGQADWMQSYAYIPVSYSLNDRIRVYVAFLDDEEVGRLGYVDVSRQDPTQVLGFSSNPILDIGAPGTFDDSGVTPSSIVEMDDEILLYYIGWQRGVRVRYYLITGLAVSTDGGNTFERCSEAPLLDRTDGELFVRSAPHVIEDEGTYKMWYIGGNHWQEIGGKEIPTYDIRYKESEDGYSWSQDAGTICMETEGEDEFALGKPFVIHENGTYRMWYSSRRRSTGYRLGYAESDDGLEWRRKDTEVGIDVSNSGWDSEMICFSNIIDVEDQRYLFYNGNEHGKTGFGVARLEHDT